MEQQVSPWARKTLRIGLLFASLAVPLAARAQTGSPPLYGFEVVEVWIPMKDGVRLAANLFMPKGGKLKDRVLIWRSHLDFRSDKTNFFYRYKRELLRNGPLIREKVWEETLPRDHQ